MSFSFDFEGENEISIPVPELPTILPTGEVTTEQKIVSKEAELATLEAGIKARVEKSTAIAFEVERLRSEAQNKINVLQQTKHEIDAELFDTRRTIRSLKNEIDALKRVLAQELANAIAAEEFQSNALLFSKRIADYSYMDRILPHQKEGAFILATAGRAILGDKRGLGKTLTSIATLDSLQVQKCLVVVPDDVLSNFVAEVKYWAPHRTVFPVGKMPKSQREFSLSIAAKLDQYVIVVNYSAWRKDKSLLDSIIALGLECVIADEAHEMKNTDTSAYKGVKKIVMAENCCPKCKSLDLLNDQRQKATFDRGSYFYSKCLTCKWRSDDTSFEWDWLDRKSVKYVFPMTGTVILNKPQDLFSQLHLVDPVTFDREDTYLRMYCQQDIYTGRWSFQAGGMERLTSKLSGKYLARDDQSAGVIKPPQNMIIHTLELDPELYAKQYKVIEQLSKHAAIMLDSGLRHAELFTISLITRKRQANVWPAGIQLKNEDGDIVFNVGDDCQESIKLDKIITDEAESAQGLIPELTEEGSKELGARVVVFSQFKGPLREIERRCKEASISVVRFDGDTPDSIRNEVKRDFDRKHCDQPDYHEEGFRWQVLLCNYRTGGTGLNFTACTETIILDEEWNPGKADQAFGRTDRIGQTSETNVHILRLEKSIDTWMVALNEEKAAMINGFESSTAGLSDSLLLAMRNGDIL